MNENAIFRCAQGRLKCTLFFVQGVLLFLNSLNLNVFPLTRTTVSNVIYLLILPKNI
jgi:hypothetical protein